MINRVGLWMIGVLLSLPAWAWAAAGTVQVVMGPARIIQSTGQERAAIKGDQIFVGDIITTGAAGQVQVRMIDDARLWVRPNSRLVIDQYPTDDAAAKQGQAQTATRLVEGSLRAVTGAIGKASPDKVSLSTPNAVIGIRGTDFELAYFPDRLAASMQTAPGTYHRVYDGRTRLTASDMAPLDVLSGQAVFVSLKPGEGPRVLPQVPPFLNLPDGPVPTAPTRDAASTPENRSAHGVAIGRWRGGDLQRGRASGAGGDLRYGARGGTGAPEPVLCSSAEFASTARTRASGYRDAGHQRKAAGWAGSGAGAGSGARRILEPHDAAGQVDRHQWARLLAGQWPTDDFIQQRQARIGAGADTGRCRAMR